MIHIVLIFKYGLYAGCTHCVMLHKNILCIYIHSLSWDSFIYFLHQSNCRAQIIILIPDDMLSYIHIFKTLI